MTKEFLRFEKIEFTGKTEKFNVFSTHSGDYLGQIYYSVGWRHYVMEFEEECIWTFSCLNQLSKFIEELENKRK